MFLTQLGMVSVFSQSLCWPASGQGQGPAGPRARCGLLMGRLWDCGFLETGVCPLVDEAGLKSRADSLEGRARAQGILGLLGGPVSWALWWAGQ